MAANRDSWKIESSPTLRLGASQNHASATLAPHHAPSLIRHVAFNQAYDAPPLDDPAYRLQSGLPDRLQEVDFEFQRCEGFSLVERSCESQAHCGVCDVAEDSAVKRAHWVGMGLAGFKFDNRLARLNRREAKTDQLRDRRGWSLAEQPSLYPINHLGHQKAPPLHS